MLGLVPLLVFVDVGNVVPYGVVLLYSFLVAATGVHLHHVRLRNSGQLDAPPALFIRQPTPSSIPPPGTRVEKRYRLPGPRSAAHQPMRELGEAESALAEVLRQLSGSSVEQAWHTACDTAARMRAVAARLEAVELAANHAPPPERAAFEDRAASLRALLDQGLDGYRDLTAAARRMLAVSPPALAVDELREATARLAEGLRELSGPDLRDYRS
jgi:hypothetical protein